MKKVLVAEDHPENRQILCEVLISAGYDVVGVADGNAALKAVDEHRPDLAILDVNMPGKDGFAVCEALKRNPLTTQMPVIILTAQSDIDSRVKGLGLGAEDFITKPYSPRELLARVDARLRTKAETDELRKQRLLLRRTFERFVAPEVVNALMQNPDAARLGGALREVTVMFADLEGFTSLSQRVDPVSLLSILNDYHRLMIESIKKHHGTVDKLLGDGIMAIYNAPVELEDHALCAVRTAWQIQNSLAEFQQHFPYDFRLYINFGINTGTAVVGNVGSTEVMDYTAIGDSVNLAQRLQEISESGSITITQHTFDLVADHVDVRSIGQRQLRGRVESVPLYEVIGLK